MWRPDKNVVRYRTAWLTGNRYRSHHVTTVEDVIRSRVGTIAATPVSDYINFRNGLFEVRASQLHEHTPVFWGAQFTDGAHFADARFPGGTDFEGALFTGLTVFWDAQFIDRVNFSEGLMIGEAARVASPAKPDNAWPPGWTTRPANPDHGEDPAFRYLIKVEDSNPLDA